MADPITAPVVLGTGRLILRAPEPADIEAITRACQDPDIQRWTTVPSPYRREHAEFFVRTLAPEGWRTGATRHWCVLERAGGALVGTQSLSLRAGHPGTAEIGWWTAPGRRGLGYAVEAATAVAGYAFAELGVRRLEWYALVGNRASLTVAERVGFRFEGTLRAYAEHRGAVHDGWLAALLPADLAPPGAARPGGAGPRT
ncbi:GNAT family N-acetyltransferase [Kitasatospora sp. NPDC050543]|uniref:GNAT family N-acetyltransferase n=1 Tax=Kitasatospora sp. NPDC050543 TaxID=3364054 RepID=UPI0037BAE0DC